MRLVLASLLVLISLVLLPQETRVVHAQPSNFGQAIAQNWGDDTDREDLLSPFDFQRAELRISKEDQFEIFLLRGILFFLGFVGVVMLLMLVLGGYKMLMSRGEDEKYTQGKTTVLHAIIGFVVIILSYAMVNELLSSTSILRTVFSLFGG